MILQFQNPAPPPPPQGKTLNVPSSTTCELKLKNQDRGQEYWFLKEEKAIFKELFRIKIFL